MLQTLPDEILWKIFSYGGLETLTNGLALSCSRLYRISQQRALWDPALADIFQDCGVRGVEIARIQDLRSWYLDHLALCSRVSRCLDEIVLLKASDFAEILMCASTIVECGLHAIPCLRRNMQSPGTFAHYFWSHWFHDVIYRLEGVNRLLQLIGGDKPALSPYADPFDLVVACGFLNNPTRDPLSILKIVDDPYWGTISPSRNVVQIAREIVTYLEQLDPILASRADFEATITKSALFIRIARENKLLESHMLTFPTPAASAYCWIVPKSPSSEPVFMDFSRGGKVRSIQDIRDRMDFLGAVSNELKNGISFIELILNSPTNQWIRGEVEIFPTSCYQLLADILVGTCKFHKCLKVPGLYLALVDQKFPQRKSLHSTKILMDYLNSESPVRLSHDTDSNRMVGRICEIQDASAFGTGLCVVLESRMDFGFYRICRRNEVLKIHPSMLRLTSPPIHVVLQHGLEVPDIGVDLTIIGQYFSHYDSNEHIFHN